MVSFVILILPNKGESMYEIKISGMTCGGCVKSVSNALKSLDSGAEVNVDLSSQTVRIKSNKTKEEINSAIEDAGFSVLESKLI
jgi:copper chaperone